MTYDAAAPATKGDLENVRQELKGETSVLRKDSQDMKGLIQMVMDQLGKMYDAQERWKNEIIQSLDERIGNAIAASESRMLVYMENLRNDLVGMHKDDMVDVRWRLLRLERKNGFV